MLNYLLVFSAFDIFNPFYYDTTLKGVSKQYIHLPVLLTIKDEI